MQRARRVRLAPGASGPTHLGVVQDDSAGIDSGQCHGKVQACVVKLACGAREGRSVNLRANTTRESPKACIHEPQARTRFLNIPANSQPTIVVDDGAAQPVTAEDRQPLERFVRAHVVGTLHL